MLGIIDLLKDMVANGQAPGRDCHKFGVGYEEAFQRLEGEILEDSLRRRGKSLEKFIVGPFGCGKTHFLRQLMEIAQSKGFITSEVQLDIKTNITEGFVIYKEIMKKIMTPDGRRGVEFLIGACMEKVRSLAEDNSQSDLVLETWIESFRKQVILENPSVRRILFSALNSFRAGEELRLEKCLRWLEGEITDKKLAKELDVEAVGRQQSNRFAREALFSICQFIRSAGFPGTVIGYDEAEQSMNVPSEKRKEILSMFRSEITAISKVESAALLAVHALTPDVIQEMQKYPALQQRVSDPDPSKSFFDGDTNAPQIDLARPYSNSEQALENLKAIGKRLVELFYQECGDKVQTPKDKTLRDSEVWAEMVAKGAASISSRRDMVKLCCSRLLDIYRREVNGKATLLDEKAKTGHAEDEV